MRKICSSVEECNFREYFGGFLMLEVLKGESLANLNGFSI